MANFYYVTIKSNKMTQGVANEILQTLVNKCLIRHFDFSEGYLAYNTRGLIDISDILNSYDFNDDEIEIKDEFDLVYENMMTPEEAVQKDLKQVIHRIDNTGKYNPLSEELKNIRNIINNILTKESK